MEDPLEEEMATHSSILAWEVPWTEEPGGLQSTGSQTLRHDWRDFACMVYMFSQIHTTTFWNVNLNFVNYMINSIEHLAS